MDAVTLASPMARPRAGSAAVFCRRFEGMSGPLGPVPFPLLDETGGRGGACAETPPTDEARAAPPVVSRSMAALRLRFDERSAHGHGCHDQVGAADLVRYHIVGVYQDRDHIAADGSGQADVTNRVVIDLTWKLSEAKLVGAPTFQNTRTTVMQGAVSPPSAGCSDCAHVDFSQ